MPEPVSGRTSEVNQSFYFDKCEHARGESAGEERLPLTQRQRLIGIDCGRTTGDAREIDLCGDVGSFMLILTRKTLLTQGETYSASHTDHMEQERLQKKLFVIRCEMEWLVFNSPPIIVEEKMR